MVGKVKIAVIGGGSTYTPELIEGLAQRAPRIGLEELVLHVRALARELLYEPGVGPIVGAQLIVAWSHRGGRGIAEPPGRESIHANVALP